MKFFLQVRWNLQKFVIHKYIFEKLTKTDNIIQSAVLYKDTYDYTECSSKKYNGCIIIKKLKNF